MSERSRNMEHNQLATGEILEEKTLAGKETKNAARRVATPPTSRWSKTASPSRPNLRPRLTSVNRGLTPLIPKRKT